MILEQKILFYKLVVQTFALWVRNAMGLEGTRMVPLDYFSRGCNVKVPPMLLDAINTMYRCRINELLVRYWVKSLNIRTNVFHQFSTVTGDVMVDTLLKVFSLVRLDVWLL